MYRLLTVCFDDFLENLGLVNFAVVEDQNALRTGVWVHRGKLSDELGAHKQGWISRTYNIGNNEVEKFL